MCKYIYELEFVSEDWLESDSECCSGLENIVRKSTKKKRMPTVKATEMSMNSMLGFIRSSY